MSNEKQQVPPVRVERCSGRYKSSRFCALQNSFRHSVWPTDITRPSPGGYSRGGGGSEETGLEDERSGGRFRRQPRGLPADGRRDACLHTDCRAQGTSSRDLPAPNQGFRGRYQPHASQLSARVRWSYCLSRRHSADRERLDHWRNRCFWRRGFPGRDRQQCRRGSHQRTPDKHQMIQISREH